MTELEASPILGRAELAASNGASFKELFHILRGLGLEEFGKLFVSLPNSDYPSLSKILPAMAPDEVQAGWSGCAGLVLYGQTLQFARVLETAYSRYAGSPLSGENILDFGCRYGRQIRMMYYFSNPDKIWGVDPWQLSLQYCKDAGLPGNFRLCDVVPEKLPVGDQKFEFGFAYSVFTHLTRNATAKALAAIRRSMFDGALFIATVRPIEFWTFLYEKKRLPAALEAQRSHQETGYGFLPPEQTGVSDYGDSSFNLNFFRDLPGWTMLGEDTMPDDIYQIAVILKAS